MKKILVMLVLIAVIGDVNAASCTAKGERCTQSSDCCSGAPYCHGGSQIGDYRYCQTTPGNYGRGCYNEDDAACNCNLRCVRIGSQGYHCSECEPGAHWVGGVEWSVMCTGQYVDGTNQVVGGALVKGDRSCLENENTCSCNYAYGDDPNNVKYYTYGMMNSNDDQCDACTTNEECYDRRCKQVSNGRRLICLEEAGENCCSNNDCNSGYYCQNHVCTVTAPTSTTLVGSTTSTSTTMAVTTSTLPYQITTTTTLFEVYEGSTLKNISCAYLLNVTQSSDDGYTNFITDTYYDNTDLVLFESGMASYGLNLTFRHSPLGFNTDGVDAYLFLYTKYVPPELFNFTYNEEWGWQPYTELGLTTQNEFLYKGFNEQMYLRPNSGDPIFTTGFGSYDQLNHGHIVNNDTWFGVNVSKNVLNQILYFRNNQKYKYDNSININFLPTLNGLSTDFVVYSYDDDPNYAPRLCLNGITANYDFNECTTDDDCDLDQYCETGWSDINTCVDKKQDYTLNNNDACYRNHECLSGKCSQHNTNSGMGDYPSYSPYAAPYSLEGQCLPNVYNLKITTVPEILGLQDEFKVYLSTQKADGAMYYPKRCEAYMEDYYYKTIYQTNYSWAFSDEAVLDGINRASWFAGYPHTIEPIPGNPYWNFVSKYNMNVSKHISEGEYKIFAKCYNDDSTNTVSLGVKGVNVVNKITTYLKLNQYPSATVSNNTKVDYRLEFQDYQKKPLSGAECIAGYNGLNTTFSQIGSAGNTQYKVSLLFNKVGSNQVEIWCNKSNYERQYQIYDYTVLTPYCSNGVMDNGETGVDCGGSCPPCGEDNEDKLDPGAPCSIDSQCKSNYCDVYDKTCQTKCLNTVLKCGGSCPACSACLLDGDCSSDGSYWCNTTYECEEQSGCVTDADCKILNGMDATICDSDGVCRYPGSINYNQTIKDLTLKITPLSGVKVNKPEGLLSVFNCDDDNNGFTLETNVGTSVKYTFNYTTNTPSIPQTYNPLTFGEDGTTKKTMLIPELCKATNNVQGGFTTGQDSRYAKIKFLVCSPQECLNQYVDVITFKYNLENSLYVGLDTVHTVPGSKYYALNATNRTLQVWGRTGANDEWLNLTTGHLKNIYFNQTGLSDELEVLGSFYLKLNSSFGEEYIYRNTDSLPLLLTWDDDKKWFKLNEAIKLQGWMIYPILAFIIVLAAYYNYRSRREG